MVQDNAHRTPSTDPDVHRELVVVDPPLEGRDVGNVNRASRARLKARALTDDMPVPTHDLFTHAAAVAGAEAGYWLGLHSDTYLRTTDVGGERRLTLTEGAQRAIRDPESRTDVQLTRARDRQSALDEGPRYYDELARKVAPSGGKGAHAALEYAQAHLGVHEQPAGSNWGGLVQDWIRLAGYTGPVPWCGCFVNSCLVAAGVPNGRGWIGYTPAIVAHARAGTGGWSWHQEGQPGDLILFDNRPGGDIAVHVGIVVQRVAAGHYITREGNTSSGRGGSQDNGGVVAQRDRVSVPAFRIVGFARPPW